MNTPLNTSNITLTYSTVIKEALKLYYETALQYEQAQEVTPGASRPAYPPYIPTHKSSIIKTLYDIHNTIDFKQFTTQGN